MASPRGTASCCSACWRSALFFAAWQAVFLFVPFNKLFISKPDLIWEASST